MGKSLSVLQNVHTGSGAHPASYSMITGALFGGGWNCRSLKLTTHLHLVPRLRMSGAIPLLPLYAFVAWTGKALPFYLSIFRLTLLQLLRNKIRERERLLRNKIKDFFTCHGRINLAQRQCLVFKQLPFHWDVTSTKCIGQSQFLRSCCLLQCVGNSPHFLWSGKIYYAVHTDHLLYIFSTT